MSRQALAILSVQNLLHNIQVIRKRAPKSKIIAVVKANAFGHGLRSTALNCDKEIDEFGVASIDEALALRKVGIQSPIVLMEGVFEPDELLIASCQNLPVVFHSYHQLEWLKHVHLPVALKVWIKCDTGMGRLGFSPTEVKDVYDILKNNPNIAPSVGLMSHYACADELNHPKNIEQFKIFETLSGNWPGPKSFSNSGAIFQDNIDNFDYVRPGLAIYGISPLKDITSDSLGLKPVMTLQTRLIAVKNLPKKSTVGYGATFTCQESTTIGVVAIGYGDGYLRTLSERTPVLVNEKQCSIIGRISMDMTTIDLSNVPNAKVGDVVTLWGDGLPIEQVVKNSPLIPYDLLTAVQMRVKFHWTLKINS